MYKTPWFELFTQIGYVIAITLILYFIVSLFRIFFIFIKKLFNRKPKQADKNIVKPIDWTLEVIFSINFDKNQNNTIFAVQNRIGTLAEWLGAGLQNRLRRFESAKYLWKPSVIFHGRFFLSANVLNHFSFT